MARDMSEISVNISETTRSGISRAFGPFKSESQELETLKLFTEMSVKALSDWLTGQKRYRSLTEQYIDWVEQIYLDLLPEDEAPSTERIYNSLNLPHGQASYIARVLAAKTLVQWRSLAVKELLTALKDVEKDARDYISEGDQSQGINLQISQIALFELTRICSERRRLDRSFVMPQTGARSGDYRFVSVPACTIADLIDNPNW